MTPRFLIRALARVLPLLLLSFAVPTAALSQPPAPAPSDLAPEARARLAQAAEDARLVPWQRDVMLNLTRTGAADAGAAQPALASGPADGAWSGLQPITRRSHSAIYDPVRNRMVVFGGKLGSGCDNDVWALSLTGTPAWTRLAPTGTPPSVRYAHTAIYDPVRDRMVVFGGYYYDGSDHYLNDVWALSLAGTPAWTRLASTSPVSARHFHSAIYDPVRDRMVVFAGNTDSGYRNDVWALSLTGTPAWTQLTPTGTPPGARGYLGAIYDPARDRMVVFGGMGSGYLNDVWALSLEDTPAWTQQTPSGTPPNVRGYHSAVYDLVGDRMVVFGGVYGSELGDAWALSLPGTPAWTQLTSTVTLPAARYSHTATFDPVRDRVVVFGGHGSSGPLNDVWALAGEGAWTQLAPAGTPPSVREGHSAIYDPVRDRVVVFGGGYYSYPTFYYLNDVWALSLTGTPAWTQLSPTGTPPAGRYIHSAVYDPVRDRMVVFGGGAGSGYLNDVWALSLAGTPAWTQLTPTGASPGARSSHNR